ncbi:hypothetical protein [Nakamurella leprariae]|uniref:Uncharacterized protein n=1 Tax=Nakamurella leprariae TaxID=2803911 RepID=A0A939BZS7_9ACTN|nr:hypothetical protein [Nakamurella leprariae]MBM9468026.1 hypothetical protein [Nakamurella leprariae]
MERRPVDSGDPGIPDADAALLAELAAAVHSADAVPDQFRRAAVGAYAWRTVDEELALLGLAFDSADTADDLGRSSAELAGAVRAGGDLDEPRALSFQIEDSGLELEITDTVVRGQLLPPAGGEVELLRADGSSTTAVADADGEFSLPRPEGTGPVRFRCRPTGGRPTLTPWTTL